MTTYTKVWNTTTTPNGPHTIYAKATDTSGNTTQSASISVAVNNTVTKTIKVTYPNLSGTIWHIGKTNSIKWISTGITGLVKIEISRSGVLSTIFNSVNNSGAVQWVVTGPTSRYCKIRITSLDNLNIFDESDTFFRIN